MLEVQNSAVFCHSNTLLETLNHKPSFGEYFARRLSRKLTHRQFHVPGVVALFILLKFTCNFPFPVSTLISNLTLWCGESAGSSVSYPSITRFLLILRLSQSSEDSVDQAMLWGLVQLGCDALAAGLSLLVVMGFVSFIGCFFASIAFIRNAADTPTTSNPNLS